MVGIQSRATPESPAAAKAQRRLEKRPLRNVMDSDDLEATNGALLGSADSTAIASKASSHQRKRTYRESPFLEEEPTAFPMAQLIAETSDLPVDDQPASTQHFSPLEELSPFDFAKPKLPVHRPTERNARAQSKGKAAFSRLASSPNLREDLQPGLP
ncbi:hypothetical protein BGX30_004990, partial [Mortierella sp. GBA39]